MNRVLGKDRTVRRQQVEGLRSALVQFLLRADEVPHPAHRLAVDLPIGKKRNERKQRGLVGRAVVMNERPAAVNPQPHLFSNELDDFFGLG